MRDGRRFERTFMSLALAALIPLVSIGAAVRPARPARTAKPAVRFTIAVSGDLLIHAPVWARAQELAGGHGYDFRPLLRRVRPTIRKADLAFCHVETPMTPRPPRGYPVFNTPPALARAIRWTGWDACDTASNHSLDQGQYGVNQTGYALSRAHVGHTGSSRSRGVQRRILMLRTHGVKVALLAYTEMTNGEPLPHPWSVNLARSRRILADAKRARRQGAAVVVVNLHWGTENQSAPSGFQRRLAAVLTRSRYITAVVGQHVHLVQAIRRVHGRFVVYGEGNLLSNQSAACCPAASQDGMIVLLHVVVDARGSRVGSVAYVPTWVSHPDFTVVPVIKGLRHHWADRSALRASLARTRRVVGPWPRY